MLNWRQFRFEYCVCKNDAGRAAGSVDRCVLYCTEILKSQGMEWNFNILMSHSNANAGKMNKFFFKISL